MVNKQKYPDIHYPLRTSVNRKMHRKKITKISAAISDIPQIPHNDENFVILTCFFFFAQFIFSIIWQKVAISGVRFSINFFW